LQGQLLFAVGEVASGSISIFVILSKYLLEPRAISAVTSILVPDSPPGLCVSHSLPQRPDEFLEFGAWCFSGAWSLDFGAFLPSPSRTSLYPCCTPCCTSKTRKPLQTLACCTLYPILPPPGGGIISLRTVTLSRFRSHSCTHLETQKPLQIRLCHTVTLQNPPAGEKTFGHGSPGKSEIEH
jgi:hypothetical protein